MRGGRAGVNTCRMHTRRGHRSLGSRARTAALYAALALLGAGVESVEQFINDSSRPSDGFGRVLTLNLPPWLTMALLVPFVGVLARRFPLGRDRLAATLPLHFVGGWVFAAAHYTLLTVYHRAVFPTGGEGFVHHVRWMLYNYLVHDMAIYWAAVGVFSTVEYYRALRQREVAAAELRASLNEARLHALRAQLHPHFLFNALNTVSMQVRQGLNDQAVGMLSELGDLLRHLLRGPDAHEAPLREELEFTRRYLEIERVRFGERLRVSVEVARDAGDVLVPSLVLQPLVENAVRHGVSRRAGPGRIDIRARRDGERLRLEVRDDGAGLPAGWSLDAHAGIGLRNTRDRLARLYGGGAALEVRAAPGRGVVASLSLPWREAARAGAA